jgi:hypothetical protein
MIPKSGHRFPACAKPWHRFVVLFDASAGQRVRPEVAGPMTSSARSEKIMLSQKAKAKWLNVRSFRFGVGLTRSADLFNPKARILADHWR